jgi:hypothetical protein
MLGTDAFPIFVAVSLGSCGFDFHWTVWESLFRGVLLLELGALMCSMFFTFGQGWMPTLAFLGVTLAHSFDCVVWNFFVV